MKKLVLLACVVLAVGACGSGRKAADTGSKALTGLRGVLSNAFAGGSSDDAAVEGGGLCGIPSLVGEPAGNIPGKLNGCGVNDAVRVTSVGGVSLSQPALMNCRTAEALTMWTEGAAKPALARLGQGLREYKVAAHYACRTRNHKKGAKISEHGKGNAIDISAFRLKDGSEISVLSDWGRGAGGKALRTMRSGACGPFKTVLGPGSDAYHDDHFHMDTAQHRGGGTYCR